jgi:hypothetical protein
VNNSGNGTGNTVEIDPKAGQKVTINKSGNGTGNTIVVAPDPHGNVVINASGNGKGDKIIVEEAPGEHVTIRGSGNGAGNNIEIVKVPGPSKALPPIKSPGKSPVITSTGLGTPGAEKVPGMPSIKPLMASSRATTPPLGQPHGGSSGRHR